MPCEYSESTASAVASSVTQPMALSVAARDTGWCSLAVNPRCAALMRRAASFDTRQVGAILAWPMAAPMMRLSGTCGSSPWCSRRSRSTLFTSMCRVPESGSSVSGVGSANDPPAWRRSSSMLRNAVRAARPTSSMRVFRLSSSSTTVSGITTAQPANACIDVGSAISTDVSSTMRCGTSESDTAVRSFESVTSAATWRRSD